MFLANVVLARILGEAEYGIYSFGAVVASIFGVAATLGIGASAVRFLPDYIKTGAFDYQRGFVLFTIVGSSASGVVTGALFWAVITAYPGLFPVVMPILLPLLVLAAIQVLNTAITDVMRAYTWSVHAIVFNSLLLPAFTALGAYVLWRAGSVDAAAATWIAVTGNCLSVLLQLFTFWRRVHTSSFATATASYNRVLWIKTGIPITLSFATSLLMFYSETTLVAIFLSPAELGVYRVVSQVSYLLAFVPATIYSAIGGLLSREYQHGRREEFAKTLRQIHWLITTAGLVLASLMAFASTWMLSLFGPGFDSGRLPLIIVVAASVVRIALGPSELLLVLSGRERQRLTIEATMLCLSVGIGLLLVPKYGLVGAAITHAAMAIGSALFLHVVAAHATGIRLIGASPPRHL